MITVLLWGDRWWLPRQKMPVPFGDPGQAAAMLAAAWPERDRRLRLIYQPEDLVTVTVSCPDTNRATLALALAQEHPAVGHPGLVWSYEPILPAGETYGTLLHHETRPALFALVHGLEERGFAVESVWPMATWLNALPPDLTESGAITVFALHSDRFCLYRHSAAGVRSVHSGQGSGAQKALLELLRPVASENPGEFVLCVATDPELMAAVEERVALAGGHAVGIFTLPEALARSAVLPPGHPAQMLPPVPRFSAPRLVNAATLLLFLGALVGGAVHMHAWNRNHAAELGRLEQRRQLEGDIEHRRANRVRIASLQSEVAALRRTTPSVCSVLRNVAATIPAEVVVTALYVTRKTYEVNGWSKEEAADAWAYRLGADTRVAAKAGGSFSLQSPIR